MAKIIINSVDSFGDKTSQKMIAKKTIEGDFTIFTYDNKYGKGQIRISPYCAEIYKHGEIESHLLLKPELKTDFKYKTSYFHKLFKVFCKSFNYSENMLTTSYIIYDNNVELNQLEIEIIEVQ